MDKAKVKSDRRRIEGLTGLQQAVEFIISQSDKDSGKSKKKKTLLIFDFDRTLTNGFATPGEQDVGKRVRGGQLTLDALAKASSVIPSPFYIVTARSPTQLVIEQLLASLSGAQKPLAPFFVDSNTATIAAAATTGVDTASDVTGKEDENGKSTTTASLSATATHPIKITKHHGRYIAIGGPGGRLYASDMEKGTAVSHILSTLVEDASSKANEFEEVSVHFFDDNIINVHSVASMFEEEGDWIGEKTGYHFDLHVTCWWWDSFEEEFGMDKPATMVPCPSTSSDFNYQSHLTPILTKIGLTEEIIDKRKEAYKKREKEIADSKPIDEKAIEANKPKPIGKLAIPNEAAQALGANFFLNRKPPPAAVVNANADASASSLSSSTTT